MLINGVTTLFAEGWEVFYKNGNVFSSLSCNWEDIPQDGVLSVIIWHEYHVPDVRKKTILSGHDYYFYKTKDNWGCTNDYDTARIYDFKKGVWATDAHMEEIQRTVFEKLDNG